MKTSLVVTTINKPNKILNKLAFKSKLHNWNFVIIGDKKTPKNFKVINGNFISLKQQKKLNFNFSKICPENSYSRKNIGYLISMKKSDIIVETDDDNFPKDSFFKERKIIHKTKKIEGFKWINIYSLYLKKKELIWPRGIPLDEINDHIKVSNKLKKDSFLIQQGLCDKNPDVDSIYRIINDKINVNFKNLKFNLNKSLSTFNSQNTTWFREVFVLMYLPVTCTMRCTDIWRSIIALKIMNLNNKKILFHGPTMSQFRNQHNLIKDFMDEIPMFENNKLIYNEINKLKLKKGKKHYSDNIYKCYKKLVDLNIIEKKELFYLKAWIIDSKKVTSNSY